MPEQPRVLLIDDQWGRADDPMIPSQYGELPFEWLLESAQDSAGRYSAEQALYRVRKEANSLGAVLLDLSFGKSSDRMGLKILEAIRSEFPVLPVLIFTSLESRQNFELVVSCMEIGANEFVEKAPSARLMELILQAYIGTQTDLALYGNSIAVRTLRSRIARIAFSGETSVLVVGESGTGKELVARALHRQGPQRTGRFVAKNCADSDTQLLDSELFGHEKGAFTGSTGRRTGLIEEADGGTLFLDEVADMPLSLQAKLLRALETRTIRRLGGNTDIQSKFQLVCATNKNPNELIAAGLMREDFFYRVAAVTLQVAPLRDRGDDVIVLSELFLRRFKQRGGASYPGQTFGRSFKEHLKRYGWPGNVRELRNFVERAVILSTETEIEVPEAEEGSRERSQQGTTVSADRGGLSLDLPVNASEWSLARIETELRLAIEAKKRIQTYKGDQWKAEFMRMMYPACKAANAKGFEDLLKRITHGPWGCPGWQQNRAVADLIEKLRG